MIKLTERVYYMPYNQVTDRPNLGYVKGDKYCLMIDAGNSKKHVDAFLSELSELGLPQPSLVGITHWHWDHTYGMHAISAPSIACSKTNTYLETMATWSWNDEAMAQRLVTGEDIPFCDEMIKKEYPNREDIKVVTANIIFDDVLTIDLGRVTCNMIRVGGSHSEDSVILYIPEEKILFLGDCDCEDLHHGERKYYPELLRKLYEDINAIDFDICVPGHWIPHPKQELIQYLEEELQKL